MMDRRHLWFFFIFIFYTLNYSCVYVCVLCMCCFLFSISLSLFSSHHRQLNNWIILRHRISDFATRGNMSSRETQEFVLTLSTKVMNRFLLFSFLFFFFLFAVFLVSHSSVCVCLRVCIVKPDTTVPVNCNRIDEHICLASCV